MIDNLEILIQFHDRMVASVPTDFIRYLYDKINWGNRMMGIKGPRGSGKTTLMLQRLLANKTEASSLYVTADHPWFYNHSILELADSFTKMGGKILYIDEVHKYPNWSGELKNIYDGFQGLKIIFSASSALEIFKGEADLSRRVIMYDLPGLSFREYLILNKGVKIEPVSWDNLFQNHRDIALDFQKISQPLPLFYEYLRYGYFPFSSTLSKEEYHIVINQVINTVIDSDLAFIKDYGAGTAIKLKKLLSVIAESVPFKPNYSSLSRKTEISRDSIYNYVAQMESAKILNSIVSEGKGVATLQKPDKLYLENTNYSYALQVNPEKGNIRETFLLNQLRNAGKEATIPKQGDFKVGDIVIEVRGKSKNFSQIKHIPNGYIAADDIETGFRNEIPLWMFGFLY